MKKIIIIKIADKSHKQMHKQPTNIPTYSALSAFFKTRNDFKPSLKKGRV